MGQVHPVPEPGRTLIDEAFNPAGPVYDGPKSKGRRAYDQTFWWLRAIKDLGFPIVAAWWIANQMLPAIAALEKAVERNTRLTQALVCKLEPTSCVQALGDKP